MSDALTAIGDAVIFFAETSLNEDGTAVKRPPVQQPVVYAASEGAAFVMIDETGAMFMLPWDKLDAVSVYPRGVEDGETATEASEEAEREVGEPAEGVAPAGLDESAGGDSDS